MSQTQHHQNKQLLSEQRELANKHIQLVLGELNLQTIPQVIADFFQQDWHDVMLLTLMRESKNSQLWSDIYTATLQLADGVSSGKTHEQRLDVLKRIPELLETIKSGLNSTSTDTQRTDLLLSQIQRQHIIALQTTVEEKNDLAPNETMSELLENLDQLELGQCLVLEDEEEKYIRCLTFGENRNQLVLIDKKGDVIEKIQRKLLKKTLEYHALHFRKEKQDELKMLSAMSMMLHVLSKCQRVI